MNEMSNHCDILVIGGGPVGTTAASLLCEKGYDVCLLEKGRHPRFHIGESLLPMNLPILKRLGVLEQVANIGIVKNGAEFNAIDPETNQWVQKTFYFSNAFNNEYTYAYEVRRSEFDTILFENCKKKGVRTLTDSCVTQVKFVNPGDVHVYYNDDEKQPQTMQCKYVVDASGRDTLLSRQFKLKRKNKKHQSSAIFGHFSDVTRRTGGDEGNISIYFFEHGWFWFIPLSDGSTSVGAVSWPGYLNTRQCSTEDFFWKTVRMNQAANERMKNAKILGEVQATGNFSYTSKKMWGRDFILLGDAFAFVDPVFSGGVYLGMCGAVQAAETIDQCFNFPEKSKQLHIALEKKMRKGITDMCWFIYRFTSPVMQHLFMNPRNEGEVVTGVISMLAGDIFDNDKVRTKLRLFHFIYYAHALRMRSDVIMWWWQHRRNVRGKFKKGTTVEGKPLKF